MASWKKIIVSGSDAELNALSLSGLSNQGSEATAVMINGSGVVGTRELQANAFTSTTIGTTTNSLTDGNGIADFTFNGSGAASVALDLDGTTLTVGSSGVKITDGGVGSSQLSTAVAGNGLTGGGGSAINVVGGNGIDAGANEIVITAAQTTITSVVNSGLEIGRDADNRIKFGTDNQIKFEVNGADGVIFKGSGEISASLLTVSDIDEVDSINAGSATNGNLDFTAPGTVNLRASNSTTHGLQLFGGANGAAAPHIGTVTHEFLDINVGSTDDLIVLAGAAAVGWKAGEARFIGHISASSVSASGDIYGNKFYGDGSGLTGLTSAADGTLTLSTSGAINGSATFGANDSGDTTFEVSIDNATTSALGAASFSSANFNVSSGAVSIKDGGVALAEMANLAADKIIGRANGAGSGVPTALSAAQVKTILSLTNVPDSDHTAAGYSTVTQLNASSSALQTNIDTKQATLTFGISNTNVLRANSNVANDDFLRVDGTSIEGRSASEVLSDIGAQAALTFGKSSGNALKSEEALATNDVLLMGTNNVKGETFADFRTSLLGGDLGGNFTFGDQADDTVRFTGGVQVDGDLTINGDLTTVATTNLIVEDKFTTFASGSESATDGGIIVQNSAAAGYALGYDTQTTRWVLDANLGIDATNITADAYVGTVEISTAAASGNPTYGGATKGHGTIHVDTNTGDIFIYS